MWNDDQPLLPVHLIDGDPETAWSSRGGTVPDRQAEWIRIDLAAESTVASVALVCSQKGPGMGTGKQLPKELAIKLSRDAKRWETVYESKAFSGPAVGPSVVRFDPRPAKQLWIIASNLPKLPWGHCFSIGELEVRDPQGNNLALLSRGAGVQVSSTYYGYGMDRFTQDMLWPIQYDLGFKWTRVGYDMGMYLWSYVEREQGKLQIDRRADECITEAVHNGLKVILCLDKGNWLYHHPPRKLDWKKARTCEMMETYYDHQGWPADSPELLQGYLRYVDYMVRHFKGRVAYYEICNEWQVIGIEKYVQLLRATIPVIKKADPKARVMLGSTGGFDQRAILTCLGKAPATGVRDAQFVADGLLVATRQDLKFKDATVSVDAHSDAEAGLVLRLQDARTYLLALYANQALYFHETQNGDWGPMLDKVPAEAFGPNIHLTAEVAGDTATFTVADGSKSVRTSHRIGNFPAAGAFGLFHNRTVCQYFSNFRITDPEGKALVEDRFEGKDRLLAGWTIHIGDVQAVGEGLARQLDAIGWHPFYQTDPDAAAYRRYREDVKQFQAECRMLGFKGQLAATEWTWAAPYPGAADWCSEMQKAKYSAQLMTAHSGMDILSLYNETFQTGKIDWDCNLLRNAFSVDPISAAQPQPVYYVLRSLCTVLDGFRAVGFPVRFTGEKPFDCYTFQRGHRELMFAAWTPGRTTDRIVEAKSDITLPGVQAKRAWAVDVFNGTEQELDLARRGQDTVLAAMLIKDYPVFVRILVGTQLGAPERSGSQ